MPQPVSTEPLKGMMDIHPLIMRHHAYIKRVIDEIGKQFSYEEYNLPILESLETFTHQASTELIKDQAYTFTDKGERAVILRPEITPVLARMIAKESGRYTRPLRWYTVGNCYRYERPQSGRLREFAQLNFDLIGKNHLAYDLEIFALIEALMTAFNVPATAYTLRYNHRTFVDVLLTLHHISGDKQAQFYALIDKKHKMETQTFDDEVNRLFPKAETRAFVQHYVTAKKIKDLLDPNPSNPSNPSNPLEHPAITPEQKTSIESFIEFEASIARMPFVNKPIFDPTVVRGIDYYTGVVFEVFAQTALKRSLFGGGRYDSLVEKYSAKPMSAIGFGMGIHIFSLFLEKEDLLPQEAGKSCTIYLAPLDNNALYFAFSVAKYFREKKWHIYLGITQNIQKHLDKAKKEQCAYIAILGEDEVASRKIALKELTPPVKSIEPTHKISDTL